ncbi:hypothetical protein U9M48_001507 [Paspalum notatum var. saurae]|uniref:HAT C-terminal dimerisation domain-containing protein n=1 Tax=Paspalum notatum var. saurae TaxID=547442 RepID=A0AAQ3PM52_PASNO
MKPVHWLSDPRHKLTFMRYCLTKAYGKEVAGKKIDETMVWHGIVQFSYRGFFSPELIGSSNVGAVLSGKRKLGLEFSLYKQQSRPHRSKRSEIDTYLEDPLAPIREGEDFDMLKWWEKKSELYPVLAKDGLRFFWPFHSSESAFSTAGMIIDKHRNSLSPVTVEALICTKDWLKTYNSDDDEGDDISDDDEAQVYQ